MQADKNLILFVTSQPSPVSAMCISCLCKRHDDDA